MNFTIKSLSIDNINSLAITFSSHQITITIHKIDITRYKRIFFHTVRDVKTDIGSIKHMKASFSRLIGKNAESKINLYYPVYVDHYIIKHLLMIRSNK